MSADVFRLARIEYERTEQGEDRVGVFEFRYTQLKPLAFWGYGKPDGHGFAPRFTNFRIRQRNGWEAVPVSYCGTGPFTFELAPDTTYELRISLGLLSVRRGDELRVSVDSPEAKFWSEPFIIPVR
jgi:hypothetical protein